MPCCWATGSISRASSRTAVFKERPETLRLIGEINSFRHSLGRTHPARLAAAAGGFWRLFRNPKFAIGVKCFRLALLRKSAKRKLAQQQQKELDSDINWNYASSPQAMPIRQARLFKLFSEGGKLRLQIGNLAA
jgi:hypothetical protein